MSSSTTKNSMSDAQQSAARKSHDNNNDGEKTLGSNSNNNNIVPSLEEHVTTTPSRTPQQSSPSLLSIKSFDSTVMQGNLMEEPQNAPVRRPSRIRTSSKGQTSDENNASNKNNNNMKHVLRGQLPLPTPLDAAECPLFCCFYAEFDIKVGPKVCFQSPKGFMDQDMDISIDKIHKILQASFESIQRQEAAGSDDKGAKPVEEAEAASEEESSNDNSLSIFDSCTEYIITGQDLTGNLLNLSSHQMHILTRPTILHNERYERNSLLFCVGFVLRRAGDPRLFRPILSKWALALRDLELETRFLSTQQTRQELQGQLDRLLVSLNSPGRECFLHLTPAHILSLRLFHPPRPLPEAVPDHAVPVLLRREFQFQMYDWDLAINWVICHIDGVTTALQISKIAEVDLEMVRACLRVLKHHGFVALIDMFFFTNRYETVPSATRLFSQHFNQGEKVLTEAVAFCLRGQTHPSGSQENSPSLHAVGSPNDSSNRSLLGTSLRMTLAHSATTTTSEAIVQRVQRREDFAKVRTALAELYMACSRAESLGDLWLGILAGRRLGHVPLNWRKLFSMIDHRRFATFGVVHGLLKRVHNYPMYRGEPLPSPWFEGVPYEGTTLIPPPSVPAVAFFGGPDRSGRHTSADSSRQASSLVPPHKVAALMDGKHCDDALACEFGKPLDELMEIVGKENVLSLYAPAKAKT